jgi:tRNA U55 pseudouridine synthase TruB
MEGELPHNSEFRPTAKSMNRYYIIQGVIQQAPQLSAIKIEGSGPMTGRAGEKVEMAERPVTIENCSGELAGCRSRGF